MALSLYSCSWNKAFNFPINEITTIKSFDYKNEPYYKPLILTPENYSSTSFDKKQYIVASFIYKGQKASIKIFIDYSSHKIKFINIGKESDYFIFAISELFEEELDTTKMKDLIEFSFYDGEPKEIGLLDNEQRYKLGYQTNESNTKGGVQMILRVNLKTGYIELMEKNAGLAKKNFVHAFKE